MFHLVKLAVVTFVFIVSIGNAQETACFESSDIQEIPPNDCSLLNTCKFSQNVGNATLIYNYQLVNETGFPSEEYTVRYYFDELRSECLQISACCVGNPCNETSNPLIGYTSFGMGLSGPSYSLYACNSRDHSTFVQGHSHFEFEYIHTSSTTSSLSNWWIILLLVGTVSCLLLVSATGFFIFKRLARIREQKLKPESLLDDFDVDVDFD